MKDNTKTRMTTFIKTKFKISAEIGLWIWNPHQISKSKKKIYSNRSKNNETMVIL